MAHKYVKEEDTFSTSQNGTVPKPTAQEVTDNKVLRADGSWVAQSGGGGGTSNYDQLTNRPQINGVTLTGNKSSSDLDIYVPTLTSGIIYDTTTYWSYGAEGSVLKKYGNVAILTFNTTVRDTALPAGGWTTLGKVSFKPTNLVNAMICSAYGHPLTLQIDTDGVIKMYNYATASDMAGWQQIVYFTND